MAELQELSNSFRQQTNLCLRNDWLAKILPSLREISSKPQSIRLYEKWLITHITESSQPFLPHDIRAITRVFHMSYTLQLTKLLDISTSKYQQYLKLGDKVSISELETDKISDVPTKRMYLLELTDGNTTIYGIEYKPIHSLTPNVLPGAKIVIKGMIPVRNGFVLLEGSNVNVLGGSVEKLIEDNSILPLLSRELDIQLDLPGPNSSTAPLPSATPTVPPPLTTTTTTTLSTGPIIISDDKIVENPSINEMSIANEAWLDEAIDQAVDEQLIGDDISLSDIMDEDFEPKVELEPSSPPTLTLREISHAISQSQNCLAYTHCKVFTLISKLDTTPALAWQLKAKLIDRENTKLDIRFSDQVLEKLIGFSGREFKEVIEPNKLNPFQKLRGKNGFISCQNTLKSLDCRLLISYDRSANLPIVEMIE
ncbi:RecQ-mediated genome instability protein 1-like [Oopsacas minuta]|uniref:RecQ-mediated genome instability protein 1 n=1 Tax=Oopsacas minuta TaxID=111878 RepID=A0AAV7JPV9_9METZ|nr:RecQ-mediated genome instability protein 1-like [Oopsacas minuta]